MNQRTAINLLIAADNISGISFFVVGGDAMTNSQPKLNVRLGDFPPLDKQALEGLASDLNNALKPITEAYSRRLADRAKEAIE